MMMQLGYPAGISVFYAAIFEYVVFDFIPTDNLYENIFDFENKEPYSEEADNIGYPSRYLIFNSGSVTIFIFAYAASQLLYALLARVLPSGNSVSNFARNKRDGFFWVGLTDFVNETYLTLAFCVCINTTEYRFNNWSNAFNSVFMTLIATVLIIWPFKVSYSASKLWKESTLKKSDEQLEGGSKEDSFSEESQSYEGESIND